MFCRATLWLLAALPALAGGGSVVSVGAGGAGGPVGEGPKFAREQHTQVVAPLGHAATLDCTVLRLFDKSVSWVRSRDLQILSHAGLVFTADARVSAAGGAGPGGAGPGGAGPGGAGPGGAGPGGAGPGGAGPGGEGTGGASRHSLRIERLRATDSGRYECQVNTEPKMSLFFNLTVVDEEMPVVVVEARDGSGAAGGAATLLCAARYEPAPRALAPAPLDVRWFRGDKLLDLQSSRGGVSLDTERWAARAVSRLTLAELRPSDAGPYTCAAGPRRAVATLRVLAPEHMQRDEAPHSSAHTHDHAAPLLLLAPLLLAPLLLAPPLLRLR